MSDLRQRLLAAKKDIEQKSGVQFRMESVALADLISEFVSIKISAHLSAARPDQPVLGSPVGKPSDDYLYGP